MNMKRIIKGLASGLVVAGMVGMLSTTVAHADLSTGGFKFWFDAASGDAYCYSGPQSKDNDSSSYIYYEDGNTDVVMCIVGYDGGYVENIRLPQKTYSPGQSAYITNYIAESGLSQAALRGEATTDDAYLAKGNWSADVY